MNKSEIITAITEIEPSNRVVSNPRSSHDDLLEELRAARLRQAEKLGNPAAPATVRFRVETNGFSWKIESEEFLSELEFGATLPAVGTRMLGDDLDIVEIVDHEVGLVIRAGDLERRESFDPRRIYTKEAGNEVVFKRMDTESGKPVVWSFIQGMEILVGFNAKMTRTEKVAKPTARSGTKMTQKNLAAYLVSMNPVITGEQLTKELQAAFPNARVESRHGPHYLSLSRCGKLPEAPEDDPRQWAK